MHVHILTKVWGHTCRATQDAHVCMQLCKFGADVGTQVDMQTYTDAYAHSIKGVGPEMGDCIP